MNYDKLIEMVLAGKSVNARAHEIGMPQRTLAKYVNCESFPDCNVAIMFANLAGVSVEEAVTAIATRSLEKKPNQTYSFLKPAMTAAMAVIIATGAYVPNKPAHAIEAASTVQGFENVRLRQRIRRRIFVIRRQLVRLMALMNSRPAAC